MSKTRTNHLLYQNNINNMYYKYELLYASRILHRYLSNGQTRLNFVTTSNVLKLYITIYYMPVLIAEN